LKLLNFSFKFGYRDFVLFTSFSLFTCDKIVSKKVYVLTIVSSKIGPKLTLNSWPNSSKNIIERHKYRKMFNWPILCFC